MTGNNTGIDGHFSTQAKKTSIYDMAEPQRVFSASCRIQLEELHRSLGLHTEAKGIYKEWNLVMVLMSAFSHD